MQVILPWFNKVLNPNDKSHWRIKARARTKQKNDAIYTARAGGKLPYSSIYHLSVLFCPPDNRQRDLDNCLAACKGMIDGLAIAWGVNDKQFRFSIDFGDVVKNGMIAVNVE